MLHNVRWTAKEQRFANGSAGPHFLRPLLGCPWRPSQVQSQSPRYAGPLVDVVSSQGAAAEEDGQCGVSRPVLPLCEGSFVQEERNVDHLALACECVPLPARLGPAPELCVWPRLPDIDFLDVTVRQPG